MKRKVRQKIPVISFGITLIILAGVVLIQIPHAQSVEVRTLLLGIIPILVAAFAYPLGNRKMMELLGGRLDTFQRVLAMTLMTVPVWIGIAIYAFITVGPPSMNQFVQSFIVGVSSGVIATTLFFMATDRVRDDQSKLGSSRSDTVNATNFRHPRRNGYSRYRSSWSDRSFWDCSYYCWNGIA